MNKQERKERVKFMLTRMKKIEDGIRTLKVMAGSVCDNQTMFGELEMIYGDTMRDIFMNIKAMDYAFESACRELEESDES